MAWRNDCCNCSKRTLQVHRVSSIRFSVSNVLVGKSCFCRGHRLKTIHLRKMSILVVIQQPLTERLHGIVRQGFIRVARRDGDVGFKILRIKPDASSMKMFFSTDNEHEEKCLLFQGTDRWSILFVFTLSDPKTEPCLKSNVQPSQTLCLGTYLSMISLLLYGRFEEEHCIDDVVSF